MAGKEKEGIIVTAALPYAYSIPHLGNFTGSVLPADVYFKYLKMCGKDAIFVCGSDQHGTPTELRAIKEKTTPEKLAEEVHNKIEDMLTKYGCTFTTYGKTHTQENKDVVYGFFEALKSNNYIVETDALHAYCEVDKRFLVDRLIEGTCPYCKGEFARGDQCDSCGRILDSTDLINPHCTICGKGSIKFLKVKDLAIALDKLQAQIEEFVRGNSQSWTKNATNKALSRIKEGLKPRDITRKMKWGFSVPLKGYEDHVFYVWFDALLGYIGMTKAWSATWESYWKGKGTKLIQFMGKDNIEFHTIIWPGTLIGANLGFIMPHTIHAYEHLNSKTVKFSKSRGVGLDMETAIGLLDADYWRFALISLLPETSDSEFSVPVLLELVNNLMNDKIGNLVHRVMTIAKNNKELLSIGKVGKDRKGRVDDIVRRYRDNFDQIRMREALRNVIELADMGNEIMSAEEPWVLAKRAKTDKDAAEKFGLVLSDLINIVYQTCVLLWPFAPASSLKALAYFGTKEPSLKDLDKVPKPDFEMELKPIFQKVPEEIVKKLEDFKR